MNKTVSLRRRVVRSPEMCEISEYARGKMVRSPAMYGISAYARGNIIKAPKIHYISEHVKIKNYKILYK